jgi:hypothetical protein
MKANIDIPKSNLDKFSKLINPKISIEHENWYSSLKPCYISHQELLKLNEYLYYANKDKQNYKFQGFVIISPIEVTDIVEESTTHATVVSYDRGNFTVNTNKEVTCIKFKKPN